MRLKLLIFSILLILMLTAFCQGAGDNVSPGNSALMVQPWDAKLFAFLAVLILVLFASIPLYLNTKKAHDHLTQMQNSLDGFILKHADKIDDDKLVQIIHECINADPAGAPGTARSTMALTITLIVGAALFFLVSYPLEDPANSSVKEVLLTLTGALTAIVGFYFGGKGTESKPTEPKAAGATGPVAEKPKAEEPKAKLYDIKEPFEYQNLQYDKGKTMDLANIPDDILKGLVETKKIEPYVGEKKDVPKELVGKPGWYTIKEGFRYNDDLYFAGNKMNLTDVPADILAVWIANKWIEPYAGP